jgi:hypothetical protein
MTSKLALCAAMVLTLQACSSRPREFTPVLAATPTDQAKFDADFATCGQLLASGKLNSEGRLASGAAGAAAGATTAVVGGAAASAAGLYGGGMAIASATIVALPFVAIAGAWGMAKRKRGRKERAIQVAMAGCLAEHGHDVTAWRKKGKLDPVE